MLFRNIDRITECLSTAQKLAIARDMRMRRAAMFWMLRLCGVRPSVLAKINIPALLGGYQFAESAGSASAQGIRASADKYQFVLECRIARINSERSALLDRLRAAGAVLPKAERQPWEHWSIDRLGEAPP